MHLVWDLCLLIFPWAIIFSGLSSCWYIFCVWRIFWYHMEDSLVWPLICLRINSLFLFSIHDSVSILLYSHILKALIFLPFFYFNCPSFCTMKENCRSQTLQQPSFGAPVYSTIFPKTESFEKVSLVNAILHIFLC